ncbi:MAG TPA: 50S ribosomal protein L11 methyltransferase [Flavobacteriales bacterium]|nr:50S ribosomal protein L11 methyltransferase [Flavobacteriales bacterium]HRE74865.1 50S ribosomal protein L11 methyltransferase [Flavobacteriales bacterium]HRE97475.1 50S ribosomal protein L11 methyltransferase [Flavobacteriales bacterium]HRJ36999.1 50S ribosomal protein L11 methyltransferase [Flavobacteriales bacterium]HRJ37910.1 50S ribosomal protein L11 methyltransferase [Flavobacteriales bacterium]
MSDYIELSLKIQPLLPGREILVYELGEAGAESFEETPDGLLAYFRDSQFEESSIQSCFANYSDQFSVVFSHRKIAQQNWNAEWESGFQPIVVNERCRIRAPFHSADPAFADELIIQPQMSFGTGHHETTWLMANRMYQLDLQGKSLLDMGCGTGVLAILAAKRGAAPISAIDIDEWSYLNTLENLELNGVEGVFVEKGEAALLDGRRFQVILANINRNVLLADLPVYAKCLEKGGQLLLSGFFISDVETLKASAHQQGLVFEGMDERNNWAVLEFKKD